jgi:tyrosine-protein phosphatase MSG5
MSTCEVIEADSPTLKRSFDAVRDTNLYQHCGSRKRNDGGESVCVRSAALACRRISRPTKRRSIPRSGTPAMPVQTSAPVPAAFPSFMSVFGGGWGSVRDDMSEDTSPKDSRGGTQIFAAGQSCQTHYPLPPSYQQRRSPPSVNSDSTDSSPTTTISMFDSPSITDPSPSSSPESPTSLLPLSPFQKKMGSARPNDRATDSPQPAAYFPHSRAESPASKERNVKNLSLNMNISNVRPATSSAAEGLHAFSAPTSPLRGPIKTGRRKPNNLTIQTPGFEKTTFSACEIPPTPSFRPGLKHHESSPALPSVLSPTTAPLAGMHLPPISMNRLLSRPGSESSFSSLSVSSQGLHDVKEVAEVNDPLKSQEAQERGYLDGPIRIYDSGIYLYLEPSREEASKFDTVINVAKEVANPFSNPSAESKSSVVSLWKSLKNSVSPEPQTAVSDISFKSALEWPQLPGTISPTTPKAKSTEPEYIHVPWDHSSEILDDLYSLCQIIDSRVSAGKTVLVHCQLGVSRSASLVVAYGLYKGFQPDFHSMYNSVKERSQWVGPNMSLIYQLMDFRTKVTNGDYAAASKPAPEDWFHHSSTDSEMTPRPLPVPPDVAAAARPPPPPPPKSTEHPALLAGSKSSPNLSTACAPVWLLEEAPTATRKVSLPTALSNIALSSPGPESAKTPSPVSPSLDAPPIPPRSAKRNAPHPLQLREQPHPSMHAFEFPPHTPRDVSNEVSSTHPVSYPPAEMDLIVQDVPANPSIFSPRTTEFRNLSFGNTTAGDLATEKSEKKPAGGKGLSIFSQPQTGLAIDPRSPHHRDDAEIVRSIDDVL